MYFYCRFDDLIVNEQLNDYKEQLHDYEEKKRAGLYCSSSCLEETLEVGSTAVCAFIDKSNITIANLGDSRAILIADDIIFETKDHKPNDDIEKRRINAAGYEVGNGRVDRELAVSRALGDTKYKLDKNISTKTLAEIKAVERVPEITKIQRDPSHKFLVIASDGVTNALKLAKVTIDSIIDEQLKLTNDLKEVSIAILNFCLSWNSEFSDNLTLILIALKRLDIKVEDEVVEANKIFENEVKNKILTILKDSRGKWDGQSMCLYYIVRNKFGESGVEKFRYKITFIDQIVENYWSNVCSA